MHPQPCSRVRRPGEGNEILTREVIEQIAETAAHELQRALGQNARLDDASREQLGEVRRRGRGLHDGRHARQNRRRKLFEHPPDRKIERIDVHRRAFARHIHVLADEGAGLRQAFDPAVAIHALVRQFACTLAGEREYRADAAVDVDPRVVPGRSGAIRQRVQLLLGLQQTLGQRFQQAGALVKRHLAQRRTAAVAGMSQRRGEVDPGGGRLGDDIAGRRIAQRRTAVAATVPFSAHVAL